MIRHIVLTKFKPDIDEQEIAALYNAFAKLVDQLPGATGFTGGRSQSPEQIERGYMHGFVIDFASWADLKVYSNNPNHKALGAQLVDKAMGGIDGVLVLDLEVPDAPRTD